MFGAAKVCAQNRYGVVQQRKTRELSEASERETEMEVTLLKANHLLQSIAVTTSIKTIRWEHPDDKKCIDVSSFYLLWD